MNFVVKTMFGQCLVFFGSKKSFINRIKKISGLNVEPINGGVICSFTGRTNRPNLYKNKSLKKITIKKFIVTLCG